MFDGLRRLLRSESEVAAPTAASAPPAAPRDALLHTVACLLDAVAYLARDERQAAREKVATAKQAFRKALR